jgi:hypothetical protein
VWDLIEVDASYSGYVVCDQCRGLLKLKAADWYIFIY